MKITHSVRDSVSIYRLSGDIDVYNAEWLREQLVYNTESSQVIIDTGDVMFIDSTGLAILVQAWKARQSEGGDLYLCSITPPVKTILYLTRLDTVFSIFPDVTTAFQQYNAKV